MNAMFYQPGAAWASLLIRLHTGENIKAQTKNVAHLYINYEHIPVYVPC